MLDTLAIGGMPTCNEYEKIFLGSMLLDSELFAHASDKLTVKDFATPEHRAIFDAMLFLNKERGFFNDQIIWEYLKGKGNPVPLERLAQLQEFMAPSHSLPEIISFIKRTSASRETIELAAELIQISKNLNDPQIESKIQELINQLTTKRLLGDKISFLDLQEALGQTFASLTSQHDRCLDTGFSDIDSLITGFRRKDMIVIGGRPSMGKTALLITFITNYISKGHRVAFFSAEMSLENIVIRLLVQMTGIPFYRIQQCNLSSDEYNLVTTVTASLEEKKDMLYIDENTLNVYEIKKQSRILCEKHKPEIIFIDYLQRLSATGKKDNQEMTIISSELKSLAKELNLPIVVLSQLNRGVETRLDKRPALSDLRDSGSIEQDADIVMLLYRDDYYNKESEDPNIIEITVSKNRNGPTGGIKLRFNKPLMSFESLTALKLQRDNEQD